MPMVAVCGSADLGRREAPAVYGIPYPSVSRKAAIDGQRYADDEARTRGDSHNTACAISSAVPRQPIGCCFTNSSIASFHVLSMSATIGV